MVNDQDFDELFRSFQSRVFRLEALPTYWVPDDGRFQAFLDGRQQPPSSSKGAWLETVATSAASGKLWQRARIVDEYSSYVRFELEIGYPGNVDAGENIYVVDGQNYEPTERRDFWLFDDTTILWMDYDDEGRLNNRSISTGAAELVACIEQRDKALNAGEAYKSFMEHYSRANA